MGAQGRHFRGARLLNVAVWSYALRSRDLEIVFLDVGQGDAALVRFPDGKTMVVDGGERSEYFDHGEQVLLPFLALHGRPAGRCRRGLASRTTTTSAGW